MWISKKRYDELIEQKDNYERIASETIQLNGRVIDSNARILEEMKEVQELNHRLQQHNEELLARIEELLSRIKELEAEKEGLELRVDILNADYNALDLEHVKICRQVKMLCKELDCYEERCRYLEDEIGDKEGLEARLEFVAKQRDYYCSLLESTSAADEEGKVISGEVEE